MAKEVGSEIGGVAKDIFRPEEKLIKALREEMREHVEEIDDAVDEFNSFLRKLAEEIVVRTIEKLTKGDENFRGCDSEVLEEKVYKMCLAFAKERYGYMYGKNEVKQ